MQEIQGIFRSLEQSIVALDRNIATSATRSSNDRLRAAQKEAGERQKVGAKIAQDEDRQAKVGLSAIEKSEREKVRAAERTARVMASIRERSATMAGQYAAREADREIREAERVRAAKERFARSFAGNITGSISGSMRGIVGVGRGIANSALQVGGGFSVADSVQREIKLTGIAGNIAASGNADPDGKKWRTSEILSSARSSAGALSMDTEEMLGGIEAFKKLTGNTGRAISLAPQMGRLAVATGTNMKDMMSNAGNIALSDPKMTNDDVMRLAMVQTKQGMTGAVEMSDLAKYGGRLTAGASLFGGDRSKNIATMGAFAQLGRAEGGAASAAEAALAAQRFATDVQKHSKGLEKMGITVGDGKGGLRAADEIVKDMVTKSGGDVTKFNQFGLGERGVKVLTAVSNEYRAASGGTRQKGESDADYAVRHKRGIAAVDATLGKFTEGLSDADVEVSLKERLADADKQVTKVMNELRDAVGTQLLPEFLKLVPVLRDLTPMIADVLKEGTKFAESFAKNPIQGIGKIIAVKLAADIAGAGIGEAVKNALSTSVGQKVGSLGLIASAATIAIATGIITIDKLSDDLNKGRNKSLSESTNAVAEAKGIEAKVREGKATPADLERLTALQVRLREQVDSETKGRKDRSGLEILGGGLMGGVAGAAGMVDTPEAKAYQAARDEQLRQSKEALDAVDEAAKKAAASLHQLADLPPGYGTGTGTRHPEPGPTVTLPLSARP